MEMAQESPKNPAKKILVPSTDRAFLTFAESVADLFERRGEPVLRSVVDKQGFRGALIEVYRALHRAGALTLIEELPPPEKTSLWVQAKELGVDPQNKKEAQDSCRALHGLAVAIELHRAGKLKGLISASASTLVTPKN